MDKLEDVKWRMIGWFSQLWTQLWTQLRKKPEKKKKEKKKRKNSVPQLDLNPWPSDTRAML